MYPGLFIFKADTHLVLTDTLLSKHQLTSHNSPSLIMSKYVILSLLENKP